MFILLLLTELEDKHCWYHYDYDCDCDRKIRYMPPPGVGSHINRFQKESNYLNSNLEIWPKQGFKFASWVIVVVLGQISKLLSKQFVWI